MTDIALGAVGWIELLTPFDKRFEFLSELPQFAYLDLDLAQLGAKELRDMAARVSAIGANVEHTTNLGQGEAGALGSSDERDPFRRSIVVDPVAV